ncbi:hypothetical protein GCM10017600_09350 [Streptosporangium carneum]|uniref:non-specific serine/threonine protein kinase n=1 Tax=Streptosporangium carneum TaxID=47481 RepID=A0A9W6HW88_9ACTN|nr:hypothetical protein GCM10017600_09350 [Streptosporangium carneum]
MGSGYLLEEIIGRGAAGVVWRGRRHADGHPVAVKLLHEHHASQQDAVNRFLRERTAQQAVRHPHLVPVYDHVAEGVTMAIVMELVEGENLRAAAARGAFTPALAAMLLGQVSEALAAIHAAGVVHRDVKPENVLVTWPGGRPWARLTDFGVALIADGQALTHVSQVVGTQAYLAPEAAQKRPTGAPADVYALGVTAYELFAGHRPFTGDNPVALMRAHLEDEPLRPGGLDEAVWELIRSCLAKRPQDRPGAGEVAERFALLAARLPASPPGRTAGPASGGSPASLPNHAARPASGGSFVPLPGHAIPPLPGHAIPDHGVAPASGTPFAPYPGPAVGPPPDLPFAPYPGPAVGPPPDLPFASHTDGVTGRPASPHPADLPSGAPPPLPPPPPYRSAGAAAPPYAPVPPGEPPRAPASPGEPPYGSPVPGAPPYLGTLAGVAPSAGSPAETGSPAEVARRLPEAHAESLPTSGATVPVPDAPAEARVARRSWLWPVTGGLAALLAVAVGAGLWFGGSRPSAAPASPSPSPSLGYRQYYLPVTVTSPDAGTIRLDFSDVSEMPGFVSYVVYRGRRQLAQLRADQGPSYLVPGLDRRSRYCFEVWALVRTDRPAPARPRPACRVADGRPTTSRRQ